MRIPGWGKFIINTKKLTLEQTITSDLEPDDRIKVLDLSALAHMEEKEDEVCLIFNAPGKPLIVYAKEVDNQENTILKGILQVNRIFSTKLTEDPLQERPLTQEELNELYKLKVTEASQIIMATGIVTTLFLTIIGIDSGLADCLGFAGSISFVLAFAFTSVLLSKTIARRIINKEASFRG